jgi:hypothetical protein
MRERLEVETSKGAKESIELPSRLFSDNLWRAVLSGELPRAFEAVLAGPAGSFADNLRAIVSNGVSVCLGGFAVDWRKPRGEQKPLSSIQSPVKP